MDFRSTSQCMLILGTWFLMSKYAGLPVAHFPSGKLELLPLKKCFGSHERMRAQARKTPEKV